VSYCSHPEINPHSYSVGLVVKVTTVSQLVDELSRFTDAEQWLIVGFVALMVVLFTCWVGFAVVLVTRTVLSLGRRLAAWRPAGGSQTDERGSLGVLGRAAIAGNRPAVGLD
jgi:hypothetical protein